MLINADRMVNAERLIDVLWNADPPPTAKAQLHNAVSALRRRLRTVRGGDVLHTRPGGYQLDLGDHPFDLAEFRMRLERGRSAAGGTDHARVITQLTGALQLWRGPTMADVTGEWATTTRRGIEDERLSATELLLQSRLALGLAGEVLADLSTLLVEHPYRERLHEIHMLALVTAGRRADALQTYREVYRRYVDDLGVEPGGGLASLHSRILAGEAPGRSVVSRLIPRQLPPLALELVGRRELAAEVTATISRHRPTVPVGVLTGPGGIGKTSLAVSVSHELASAYPDGQLYANLLGSTRVPADPLDVLARWLRALGASDDVPTDPDERIDLYRSHLADRRVLVVLDDAATERQVRPLLPGSTSCAVLVTSRGQLSGLLGAARWTVPQLSTGDALTLFGMIAGQVRTDAEPADAHAIVAACGHLPLAVAISAARVAARPDRPLAEFRERLAAARGRLDELSVGDLDVRATIGLSYESLDPPVRLLLRRLGLLTSTEQPAWVVEQLSGDRPRLVDRLVDVHLIERLDRDVVGQHRFRMHDLIADYARERALADEPSGDQPAEPGHRAVRVALLHSWLGLASQADDLVEHGMLAGAGLPAPPAPDTGLTAVRESPRDWFDLERTNLVAAVDEAAALGLTDVAGRLALRLCGYFGARGYEDRERTLRTALAVVREHGPDDLHGRLLSALISAAAHHDRLDGLADLVREELAVADRTGDQVLRLRALVQGGLAARRVGDLVTALDWQRRAVSVAGASVQLQVRTTALAGLAATYLQLGRPADGLPYAREAVDLERAEGSPRIRALHEITFGTVLTEAGRFGEAGAELSRARETAVHLDDELVAAFITFRLAYIDLHCGRPDAAELKLAQALDVFSAASDVGTTADIRRGFGDLEALRGNLTVAMAHLRQALDAWGSTGARLEVARTHARLELIAVRSGDDTAAERHRRRWRATLDQLGLDEACLLLPTFLGPSRST